MVRTVPAGTPPTVIRAEAGIQWSCRDVRLERGRKLRRDSILATLRRSNFATRHDRNSSQCHPAPAPDAAARPRTSSRTARSRSSSPTLWRSSPPTGSTGSATDTYRRVRATKPARVAGRSRARWPTRSSAGRRRTRWRTCARTPRAARSPRPRSRPRWRAAGQIELLDVDEAVRLPLLSPIAESEPDAIRRELDDLHAQGFRTVKIKVGRNLGRRSLASRHDSGGGRRPLHVPHRRQPCL